jgi:hypothetical protein
MTTHEDPAVQALINDGWLGEWDYPIEVGDLVNAVAVVRAADGAGKVAEDATVAKVRAAILEHSLDRFAAEFLDEGARSWLAGFSARAALEALGYEIRETC